MFPLSYKLLFLVYAGVSTLQVESQDKPTETHDHGYFLHFLESLSALLVHCARDDKSSLMALIEMLLIDGTNRNVDGITQNRVKRCYFYHLRIDI